MIRLEMNKKQEAILAAVIIIAALAAFVLYAVAGRSAEPEAVPEQPAPLPLFDTITAHMKHQEELERSLDARYKAGEYTLDSPFVIVDPYSSAPLTALVRFATDEPMKITVHITGKTEDVSISHTFNEYNTDHTIPVFGLYPDMVNIVGITAETQGAGTARSTALLIQTAPIPESFPENIVLQHFEYPDDLSDSIGDEPPFYFTYVRKSAFDKNGDYRWVFHGLGTGYATKYTNDGIMHIIVGSFEAKDALLLEVNMLGRVISAVPIDSSYNMDGHYGVYNTVRRGFY